MKTFRQFLNEKTLYHATTNPNFDPKKVPLGLHFGTKKAAMERSKHEDVTRYGKPKIHVFSYHTKGKSVSVPDFENNVTFRLHELLHKKGVLKEKPDWKTANKIGHDKYLKDALSKKSISHITYKNDYEDIGKNSHVIFDPENLRHIKTK